MKPPITYGPRPISEYRHGNIHRLVDSDGFAIAEVNEKYVRLFAAAPCLLDALSALGVKPDGYCFCVSPEQVAAGHTGECRMACAAIAKATT